MSSLTKCLAEAKDLLPADVRKAVTDQAAKLRKEGMSAAEASQRAVQDVLTERGGKLTEVETALKDGVTLYEDAPPPATPAAKAEAEAAVSRVDQVLRDMPDLRVQMDGMDSPMAAADFMAMVKAEADEMAADAPLMQIAAECALLNGP
jgi:hypothetical protein